MKKQTKRTKRIDAKGRVPESWACVDCGVNTAPSLSNRAQLEQALALDLTNQGVRQTINDWSEVYMVKPEVWKAAGLGPMDGCLCIGCLESRLGRTFDIKGLPPSPSVQLSARYETIISATRWRMRLQALG
jgi:hypothetical protein